MELFTPNPKYYTEILKSYTSSDEFIANKRVHINNEIPPIDLYDLTHSLLSNDYWKWFLGTTLISYDDVQYNLKTDAVEQFGEEGFITESTIAKYINHIRVPDYGPIPYYRYDKGAREEVHKETLKTIYYDKRPYIYIDNSYQGEYLDQQGNEHRNQHLIKHYLEPEEITIGKSKTSSGRVHLDKKTGQEVKYEDGIYYKDDNGDKVFVQKDDTKYINRELINPTYHRMEIDGVLMPEVDFMLHEGYRYLNTLYPDHPDYIEILTNNEINDEITHAGALIHYNPNTIFFDWLAREIDYSDHDINDYNLRRAEKQEALKLKVRNLTNHAFRRKFYGSKIGYKQFGADIFQHISVYQVAEYLTYLPMHVNDRRYELDRAKSFKWFLEYDRQPDDFDDRSINKYDLIYKKPFRLIDFGYSNEQIKFWEENATVWGTAWPSIYSQYDLFEYPNIRSSLTPLTIKKDFFAGQKIYIDERTGFINYILEENGYRIKANLTYENDEIINNNLQEQILRNSVTRVHIDKPVNPIFFDFDLYLSTERMIQYAEKLINEIIEELRLLKDTYDNETDSSKQAQIQIDIKFFEDRKEHIIDILELYNEKTKEEIDPYSKSLIELITINNEINKIKEIVDREALPYKPLNINLTQHLKINFKINNKNTDNESLGKFLICPYQTGAFYLPANHFITLYSEELNVEIINEQEIVYHPTALNTEGFLRENDIVYYKNEIIAAEVTGIQGGLILIKINETIKMTNAERIYYESENNVPESKYGMILTFNENNIHNGKKVVLFGKPKFNLIGPDKNNLYDVDSIEMIITAVPKKKSHQLLKHLYPNDYVHYCNVKFERLQFLMGPGSEFTNDKNQSGYLYGTVNRKVKIIKDSFNQLMIDIKNLIIQNNNNRLHPNDSYWQKVKINFPNMLSEYDYSPIKQRQLQKIYDDFVDINDKLTMFAQKEQFEKNCNELISVLGVYNEEYFNYLICMVSASLDREYYETKNASSDLEKRALQVIKTQDQKLDEMMPNAGFMLLPKPGDLYLRKPDDFNCIYNFKANQDRFIGMLELKLDQFNDQIIYDQKSILGIDGLIVDYSFGELTLGSIIDNNKDSIKEIPTDYFSLFKNGKEINRHFDNIDYKDNGYYLKSYELEINNNEYIHFQICKDLIDTNKNSNNRRKFGWTSDNFLNLFLSDDMKNNLKGEIINEHVLQILCRVDIGSNLIYFVDDKITHEIVNLNIGDHLFGLSIEDDVFITSIDLRRKTITVNKPLNISGDIVINFSVKTNTHTESIDDFYWYKQLLAKNNLLDTESIFDHGFPHISSNYVPNIIDIAEFKNKILRNLKLQSLYKGFFNSIVFDIHGRNGDENYYSIPSMINNNGDLFLEIGAYTTYKERDLVRQEAIHKEDLGLKKDREYIMKKEILDYFQLYLQDFQKASDTVSIGTSVSATTWSNGRISFNDDEYTDPVIDLKFICYNWKVDTIPYYVEIGIGNLKNIFISNIEMLSKENEPQYKSYYNWNLYDQIDNIPKSEDDFIKDNKERSLWYTQSFEIAEKTDLPLIYSIDKPIMRTYLGEYEVQKLIQFENNDKYFTTVQFSILKQVFENITKTSEVPLNVINKKFFEYDLFKNINQTNKESIISITGNNNNVTTTTIKVIDDSEFKTYKYEGVWSPSIIEKRHDNKLYHYVNYPPKIPPDNFIHYYTIIKTDILHSVIDDYEYKSTENKNITVIHYYPGQILLWEDEKWIVKDFIFSGLYGEPGAIRQQYDNSPIMLNNINLIGENTLLHCLLIKIILQLNVYIGPKRITPLNIQQLTDIYKSIFFDDILTSEKKIEIVKTIDGEHSVRPFEQFFLIENNKIINTFNLNINNCFWFTFIGLNVLETAGFQKGQNIGVIFTKENGEYKFNIILFNENASVFLLNTDRKINVDNGEYAIFSGSLGNSKDNIFLFEKIRKYINSYDINYKNILPGSVRANVEILPKLIVRGYRYDDQNKISIIEEDFNVTEDKIYFDEENKCLYSYNIQERELENNRIEDVKVKFKIKQENNKYFKNVLYLYGQYQKIPTMVYNKIIDQGYIEQINGVTFDGDQASVNDRILEIEQINVRSNWHKTLESTFYSSYCKLEGVFKGIHVDENNNLSLNISYDYGRDHTITANKFKYAVELYKLKPIKKLDEQIIEYNDDIIYYDSARWLDNGQRIEHPIVQHADAKRVLSVDDDNTFKYYKNLLVLEGEIDLKDPGFINFSRNNRLGNALTYLRPKDHILNIIGISNSTRSTYYNYQILDPEGNELPNFPIKYIDFKNNILIFVSNTKIGFKHTHSMHGIGFNVVLDIIVDIEGEENLNQNVDSFAWDDTAQQWLFSKSDDAGLCRIYSIDAKVLDDIKVDDEIIINPIYEEIGTNISTYQLIDIKDEDFRDERFNTYKTVLARDVAWLRVPVKQNDKQFIDETHWNNEVVNKIVNNDTRKDEFVFDADSTIFTTQEFDIEENKYRILSFTIEKTGTQEAAISIGTDSPVILNYDKHTQLWTQLDDEDITTRLDYFLNGYNKAGKVNIVTYIIHHEFYDNYKNFDGFSDSSFLYKLPKPETSNNIIVAAVICHSEKFKLKITGTNTKQFKFSNMTLSYPDEITTTEWTQSTWNNALEDYEDILHELAIWPTDFTDTENYTILEDAGIYTESPYYPQPNVGGQIEFVDDQTNKFKYKRYVANNFIGNQAVVIGSTLFLKTPTRTYTKIDSGDRGEGWISSGVTNANHWKRAELPSKINTFLSLTENLNEEELWNYVDIQRQITIEQLTKIKEDLQESQDSAQGNPAAAQVAFYDSILAVLEKGIEKAFIEEEPPEEEELIENENGEEELEPEPDSENEFMEEKEPEYKAQYILDGVEFIYTENGKVPNFKAGARHVWDYSNKDEVTVESGEMTVSYNAKENFKQYLVDYFAIIIGAQRFTYFLDGDSIKDIVLSSSQMIIITTGSDVITLPLNKTSSRDEMEDYSNWNACELDENYIFVDVNPTEYETRMVGINDNLINLEAFPIQRAHKAYHIEDYYVEGNTQIYVGYIMADEIVRAFIDKYANPYDSPRLKKFLETRTYAQLADINTIINGPADPDDPAPEPEPEEEFEDSKFEKFLELFPHNEDEASSMPWNYATTGALAPALDNIITYGKKYPVIFYSDDNGKTFKNMPIANVGDLTEEDSQDYLNGEWVDINKKSMVPSLNEQVNNEHGTKLRNRRLVCKKILRAGNKIKVYFENDDTKQLVGYTAFTVAETDGKSLIMFDGKNYDLDNDETGGGAANKDIPGTSLSMPGKGIVDPELIQELGKTFKVDATNVILRDKPGLFMMEEQFNFKNQKDQTLTEVGIDYIKYDHFVEAEPFHEIVRVLVSINPSFLIENPTRFTAYRSEYLDSFGNFIVPTFVQVTDFMQSNRMYSPREAMHVRGPGDDREFQPGLFPRELDPDAGIPAISEDKEHVIYQYDNPYVNSAGEMIWKYKEAKNSVGQKIYLCTENGNYLIGRDHPSIMNFFSLKAMITEDIPYQSLVAAPLITPGFKMEETDVDLQTCFNSLNNKKIRTINFDKYDPNMYIDTFEFDAVFEYLESKGLLYKWPLIEIEDEEEEVAPEILEMVGKPVPIELLETAQYFNPINGKFTLNKEGKYRVGDDFKNAIEFLEQFTTPFNPSYGKVFGDRVECFEYNDNYYILDKLTRCLLLKRYSKMYLDISVPYIFAHGQKWYNNVQFVWSRNTHNMLLPLNDNYELNGVYLRPKGYGGSAGNENFYNERPEEIDYQAFERTLIQNRYGEYLYLYDKDGVRYNSKNGLFWLDLNDQVNINYYNLNRRLNTVKFYGDDSDEENIGRHNYYNLFPTEYNIYRLEQAPIEIYTPKNIIYFNSDFIRNINYEVETGKILLSLFRIIKAGMTIDENLIKNTYTIEFKDYLNRNVNDLIPGEIKYENGKLIYDVTDEEEYLEYIKTIIDYEVEIESENEEKYTDYEQKALARKLPTIEGDRLFVVISDGYQTTTHVLNIAPWGIRYRDSGNTERVRNNKEKAKIIEIGITEFNRKELFNNIDTEIVFDGRTFTNDDNFTSINTITESFIENEISINNEFHKVDFRINFLTDDYDISKNDIIINTESLSSIAKIAKLDVRNYELEILINRSWALYNNEDFDVENIDFYIYSKDQRFKLIGATDYYDDFEIENKDDYGEIDGINYIFKVQIHNITISQTIRFIEILRNKNIEIEKWIFTRENNTEDIIFKHGKLILVDGLYGPVLMHKPVYKNFADLINNKGLIIELRNRKIIYQYDRNEGEEYTFNNIADDISYIKLNKLLEYDRVDLNSGNKYFLKFKILPEKTIYPKFKTLNHENFVHEIDYIDAERFGYDRIYINPKAYPQPPVAIRDKIYFEESLPLYFKTNFLNKDGFKVHMCNDKGKCIKPVVRNNKIEYMVLGNSLGDCRGDIYGNVDSRYNILEPLYKSSTEWFCADYWIAGKEINPFVVTISINDVYNERLKEYSQEVFLVEPKKFNNDFIFEKITDTERYATNVVNSIGYAYDIANNVLAQNYRLNFVDHKNGLINFILIGAEDFYKFEYYKLFYGIEYFNNFSNEGIYKNIWEDSVSVPNKINLSFCLNTKENILNPLDKDYGIVEITEMGLFNKKGELVAYMTHPKIQYRSDVNHLSYNLIIEEMIR